MGLLPASDPEPIDWPRLTRGLCDWTGRVRGPELERTPRRIKQWLKYAADRGTFPAFYAIKRVADQDGLLAAIESACHWPNTAQSISPASSAARTRTHIGIALGLDSSSLG